MEIIPYEQFARLRLRDYADNPAEVAEESHWEWMGSRWHNEGIGFTSFSRHVSTPDDTGGIEVSFPELSAEANRRLLTAVGLPLQPGMSHDEVLALFGEPVETHQYVPGRCSYDFTVGSTEPYVVGCTVDDTKGLIHLTVIRADLMKDEDDELEDEELDEDEED